MKRCKYSGCRAKFEPKYRSTQECCSAEHAIAWVRETAPARLEKRRQLAERKERREAKEKLRRRRDWVKLAQEAFNAFIRARDEHLPCVSCDAPPCESLAVTGGGWDCGHFRTVGAAPQHRFNPNNAAKQCKSCNSGVIRHGKRVLVAHDGDRQSSIRARFRAELVRRIGAAEVERVESDNDIRRHTVDELKEIIATYRAKLRALKLGREGIAA